MILAKRILFGFVIALALLGGWQAVDFGRQLVIDYQNFQKIVQWVAIKQQQEQRAAAQQQLPRPPAPAPAPAQ